MDMDEARRLAEEAAADAAALNLGPTELARLLGGAIGTYSGWLSGTRTRDGVQVPNPPPQWLRVLLRTWRKCPQALVDLRVEHFSSPLAKK